MRSSVTVESWVLLAGALVIWQGSAVSGSESASSKPAAKAERIGDLIWVWGNPEMAKPGPHTLATFAQANPAERARLLGAPHIVMAGLGLPDDDGQADALTKAVAGFGRLVWEISPDGPGPGPPFVYKDTIARVRRLARRYRNIEGVLLDDMSTVQIDRGFKPQHIRQIRQSLGEANKQIKIWGVLYTMSMNREGIRPYVQELDVINLWTWHAKDVVDLAKNVAECERLWPGKPIVLGLYLYDYGQDRRIPPDLLEQQCHTALKLAHAGRIKGIVFLTITDDADAVGWAARWIKQVGSEKIVAFNTLCPATDTMTRHVVAVALGTGESCGVLRGAE